MRVAIRPVPLRFSALSLLGALFLLLLPLPSAFSQSGGDDAVNQLLSIAESKHEIIQLLLSRGEYRQAFAEFKVILDLRLPVKFEEAVMKEAVIVAKRLFDAGQKDLAYQALEMTFKQLHVLECKAKILNMKAVLLKTEGRTEEAIEAYREEVELRENSIGR